MINLGIKYEGFKNTGASLNQSMNVAPGYSTEREPGYPKNINTGIKAINTTTYHDSSYNYLNKSVNNTNTVSPPLNQIKTNTIDGETQGRSKYSGIKIISSSGNQASKGR